MKYLPLIVLMALTGCVMQQLDKGLTGLIGHNIRDATRYIGYPTDQRTSMGDTLYIWSVRGSGFMPMMSTTTANGAVGGMPYYGQANTTNMVPVQVECTIQIATDQAGIIKTYQWYGSPVGCQGYAKALNR